MRWIWGWGVGGGAGEDGPTPYSEGVECVCIGSGGSSVVGSTGPSGG